MTDATTPDLSDGRSRAGSISSFEDVDIGKRMNEAKVNECVNEVCEDEVENMRRIATKLRRFLFAETNPYPKMRVSSSSNAWVSMSSE